MLKDADGLPHRPRHQHDLVSGKETPDDVFAGCDARRSCSLLVGLAGGRLYRKVAVFERVYDQPSDKEEDLAVSASCGHAHVLRVGYSLSDVEQKVPQCIGHVVNSGDLWMMAIKSESPWTLCRNSEGFKCVHAFCGSRTMQRLDDGLWLDPLVSAVFSRQDCQLSKFSM